MKKNLDILEIEPKLTKDEKKYWRIKTSEGWISCFDKIASAKVKEFLGGIACVEVIQSGDFSNIKKCYGASEELDQPEEPIETVRPGEVKNSSQGKTMVNGKPTTTMYVSYAKDIFVAMNDKEWNSNKDQMQEAIDVVKQAREAFE